MTNKIQFFILLVALLSFSACSITYRLPNRNEIKEWPPLSQFKKKPSVFVNLIPQKFDLFFEVPFHQSKPNAKAKIETQLTNTIKAQTVDGIIEKQQKSNSNKIVGTDHMIYTALKDSNLFSEITTDPNSKTDLIMEIKYDMQFNKLSGYCCSCCFIDLIPNSLSFENRLITTIKKQNGDIIGTYSQHETISQQRHILLIFIAPFTKNAEDIFEEVSYDLTRRMLLKANKDINKLQLTQKNN